VAYSNQDGIRQAVEYETQIQTLRDSLALKDENHERLLTAFGDLEKRVMKHERPADAKSEIIQFLQDQSRQIMLLKRSHAEMERRQAQAAHRWSEQERERQTLAEQAETLQRVAHRQALEFRAALAQRDRAVFDLNSAVSEMAAAKGHDDDINEQKRAAAQYLLSNLETSLQQTQEQQTRILELESQLATAQEENARTTAKFHAANEHRYLDLSGSTPSPLLAPTALSQAPLTAHRHLPRVGPAVALVARIQELEDLTCQQVLTGGSQRVAELESVVTRLHLELRDRDRTLQARLFFYFFILFFMQFFLLLPNFYRLKNIVFCQDICFLNFCN
jgi:hypothetical protein